MARAIALSLAACTASAWVLPGTAPFQFRDGEAVRLPPLAHARQTTAAGPRPSPAHPQRPPSITPIPRAQVELKVNKLTSPKTHLGYEHYSLGFCRVRFPRLIVPGRPSRRGPAPRPYPRSYPVSHIPSAPAPQPVEGIKKSAENLGEHLSGELIENSGYEVRSPETQQGARARALFAALSTDAPTARAARTSSRTHPLPADSPSRAARDEDEPDVQGAVHEGRRHE
jgi:hypothetical protein